MLNLTKTFLVGGAVAVLASAAHAAPLQGSIGIAGGGQQAIVEGGSVVGIDFSDAFAFVLSTDGDFDTLLQAGVPVDFADDFRFDNLPDTLYAVTVGGVTFTAERVVNEGRLNGEGVEQIDQAHFEAYGQVSADGYDPTEAVFSFSGEEGSTLAVFSTVTEVAEPATLGLLGAGLFGLGGALRRRRN